MGILSGATTRRPALLRCLKRLEHREKLIAMLDDLRALGVKFHSLTEAIDTAAPTGRAMWQMIGVPAEPERSLISERTCAAVKVAQQRGLKFGRKVKLTASCLYGCFSKLQAVV